MNSLLRTHNTLRLDADCEDLVEFCDEAQLVALLSCSVSNKCPDLILGYGSNVVLPTYYPGRVLLNRIEGIDVVSDTDDGVLVSVGAGEVWHDFVVYALSKNWYGLENLAMIPGSVGAAPVQNIGAYGTEISDFVVSCEVYCRQTMRTLCLPASECDFGYRTSLFKTEGRGRYVILRVHFLLLKSPKVHFAYPRLKQYVQKSGLPATPHLIFDAVCHIRSSRLPCVDTVGTVGSFFVNPIVDRACFERLERSFACSFDHTDLPDGRVKLYVGNLLSLLGWQGAGEFGFRLHANPIVLVHDGGGSQDVCLNFVGKVLSSVYSVFGLHLDIEPEVVSGSLIEAPLSVSGV